MYVGIRGLGRLYDEDSAPGKYATIRPIPESLARLLCDRSQVPGQHLPAKDGDLLSDRLSDTYHRPVPDAGVVCQPGPAESVGAGILSDQSAAHGARGGLVRPRVLLPDSAQHIWIGPPLNCAVDFVCTELAW